MKAKPNAVLFVVALLAYWIGLCNASAFYDPCMQRWLNRDPIGEPGFEVLRKGKASPLAGDANHYLFVRNNPVNFYDPLGLKLTCDDCSAYLADALKTLNAELAADYKAGIIKGTLFTVTGIAIGAFGGWAIVVGVGVGGGGDIMDVIGVSKQMKDIDERMKIVMHQYHLCMEQAAR